MPKITPFAVKIADSTLSHIRERVRSYPFAPAAAGDTAKGEWPLGTSTAYMKELCAYWADRYDWRKAEAQLNRFPQFTAPLDVGGETIPIHFVHERGSGPNPTPLLLIHGWPGSFFEFMHIVEPLAHPERFGGDINDAFDVVVPSLPGYGFSGKPSKPVGQRATALAFHTLMHDVLSYPRSLIQGGDWGSVVTCQMALAAPERCLGIHLNMMGFGLFGIAAPETDAERAFLANTATAMQKMGAYQQIQSTKPETLGFALLDSPVGTCAWIVEKFHAWSDIKNGDIESRHSKDQLLTNVMIYLVTESIKSSIWYYNAFRSEAAPGAGTKITVPTAVANFPGDAILKWPPRSYVEKAFSNIVRWTDMKAGGHFAALEEPQVFVEDVRAFARDLRK